MFHAAQAALAKHGSKAPRTHRGLRSQFSERLVASGVLEREYSRDLTKAFEVRQECTYEAYASLSRDEVHDLLARAVRFLERIKKLVVEEDP